MFDWVLNTPLKQSYIICGCLIYKLSVYKINLKRKLKLRLNLIFLVETILLRRGRMEAFFKRMFLKFSQNPQENNCAGVSI